MALVPALLDRIKRLIPPGWFATDSKAPVRNALLGGLSDGIAWITDRQAYVRRQTRIKTATGFWLDLIAWDFFHSRLMRRKGEADESFRARVLAELFRPRNTRAAIVKAVTDLTGIEPDIVELWNTGDCGAYENGHFAYTDDGFGTGDLSGYDSPASAYDVGTFGYVDPQPVSETASGAGCWGSYDYPNQMLITAYRGVVSGTLADCGGYDIGTIAYGDPTHTGAGYYVTAPTSAATDAEIYRTIAATVAGGCIGWTEILNAPAS
jgi:hypothetical protein